MNKMSIEVYKCPYCGHQLQLPVGDSCPYCGGVFDSIHQPIHDARASYYQDGGIKAVEVIIDIIVLALTLVLAFPIGIIIGIIICIGIHKVFNLPQKQEKERINAQQQPKVYHCASCGCNLNGKPEYCPNCGKKIFYDLDPKLYPDGKIYTCPACKQLLVGKPNYCPHCGQQINYSD
jgi:rubrerythrin